jgi:hypothetical protein
VGKKIGLVSVTLVVFVVVFMAFASTALAAYDFTNHIPDKSAVVGGPHDVQTTNPCSSCHIPHEANGDFLWARAYSTSTSGASGVTANDDAGISSNIKPMCYSCHDGTIASVGLVTAFSPTHSNHRTRAATALRTSGSSAGQPYGPGRDCDLCHDPHDDGNSSFLKYERLSHGAWVSINRGANFCASCHSGNADMAVNHPIDVVPSAAAAPTDAAWVPAVGDYSGTRLYDGTTHFVSTAADAQIACASCHTPHGADPNATAQTSTGTVFPSLNTMATGAGELCLNCHGQ